MSALFVIVNLFNFFQKFSNTDQNKLISSLNAAFLAAFFGAFFGGAVFLADFFAIRLFILYYLCNTIYNKKTMSNSVYILNVLSKCLAMLLGILI